jgi:hypothetical protein
MATTQTYGNVTQTVWDCVKSSSISQRGTVYDPSDGTEGTATTETPVGKLVMGFSFDAAASTITYTINSKPFLVTEGEIWSGIQKSITACGGGTSDGDTLDDE